MDILTYEKWRERNPDTVSLEEECLQCGGTGREECDECDGEGTCSKCHHDCDECLGLGTMGCLECHGSGKINDSYQVYLEQKQIDQKRLEQWCKLEIA